METEKSIENSTIFLSEYMFLYDVTYYAVGSASFTWDTFEKLVDSILDILQNSIQNGIQIGLDPLLDCLIEEISLLAPKGELSPAQWKQKRIADKYQRLFELYNQLKAPIQEEEPIIIKDINDYFKTKKFIQISSIGEYINYKPLEMKYYETLTEFLKDIKKIIKNKYNSYYKIRQFYIICKEITADIPQILLNEELDNTDFDYLSSLCNQFLNNLDHGDYLAINFGGIETLKYQTERMMKLSLINQYSDKPYLNR